MKHQQIQLASKRNFIRIMAIVAMLAVMVCGMVLAVSAADVAESVAFTNDSGITFDAVTNRWVKSVRFLQYSQHQRLQHPFP